MTRRWATAVGLVACAAAGAHADPLRLRGDALATTQSPVGLLVLSGDGAVSGPVTAEALVWMGATHDGATGDALVMAVVARREDRRAEARIGRLVATVGGLRPVHVDGVAGRVRLPRRLDVEVVGGVPVVPRLGAQAWDWLIGGRVARRLGDAGALGVAALERREAGRLATRELGLDAAWSRGRYDAAARAAVDLIDPALADLRVVALARWRAVRGELSLEHRSPTHLLPATSLFTVLGEVASDRAGAGLRWRAAPRLDVVADLGVRAVSDEVAADAFARATLRLDDRGRGAIVFEARRAGAIDGGWTGARVAGRVPVGRWSAALEAELVRPDVDRGRGTLWPWAMAALGWTADGWDAALAIEATSSPTDRARVDVLAQLGRRWELR
ncbi:MAG: hypothetical protein KBG48_21230 [Kofleriaceae bacterium]|nr:hypothetical protein [Kofleriaceae bacterium]MBP9169941.1 hypothetical protein [Kofleriaceae bacterium]MBP9858355.1 hypothetical protein [Kofleriaceae bacterium]